MNSQILKELGERLKDVEKKEQYLFQKIPNAFINTRIIPQNSKKIVISIHESNISSQLDYQDKELNEAISSYIQQTEKIVENYHEELQTDYNFASTIEHRFILSQFVTQELRYFIYRSTLATFQLEKILSQTEKLTFENSEAQPDNVPITIFNLDEYLIKTEWGTFDLQTTQKKEEKEGNIVVFLSSINSIDTFKNYLISKFQNESNYIPFALINNEICQIVSEIAGQIIITIIAREIYKLLREGVSFFDAESFIKKKLTAIALDYKTKGDSKTDVFHLGETIYLKVSEAIKNEFSNDKELIKKIGLETLRLSVEAIQNWVASPSEFFKIQFREAQDIEKISNEISHVADIYPFDKTQDINYFETYVISYPEYIKDTLNLLSSKGLTNPDYITNIINK